MEPSLDAVRFLASSTNRVRVLTELADGRATRRELQEAVDGSRSTVARVLDESHDRGWVATEGNQYWLTPLGETAVMDFRSYLETVEGLTHLGGMVNHLPPPLFALDFRHLRDATIVEPTVEDPSAPFTRAFELLRAAPAYRGLSHTAVPELVRVLRDRVVRERLDFEHVFEREYVETIRAERSAVWTPLLDRIRVYDGVVPIGMHVVDETVLVWLGETRDEAVGLLVSENTAVVSWAESLYEEYRSESEPYSER